MKRLMVAVCAVMLAAVAVAQVSAQSAQGWKVRAEVTVKPIRTEVSEFAIDVPADKVDAVLAALKQRGDLEWAERATPVRKHGDATAPATAGADSMTENRAAAGRSKPSPRAAAIVIPEREVPGIMARHWMKPMAMAVLKGMSKARS